MEIGGLINNPHTLEAGKATNHEYKVFVSTWNVGGVLPPDDTNMEDMLGTGKNLYDIYVFGFQEIVPLNAKNVLRLDESKSIPMKWNSLIGRTLNNSISSTESISYHDKTTMVVDQKVKIYPMKDGNMEDEVDDIGIHGPRFQCIITKQMVGILVAVWVKSDLKPYIHHQAVSCVGCGILGYLGNKGAVSVRFFLHETSFCFICCHLASGGKEGDEGLRNGNMTEIFARTRFRGGSRCNLPRKIQDHNRIILLGDLNYRVSLSEDETRSLVQQKEWGTLLENDQLKLEAGEGGVFEGWQEGKITFPPTYKYYKNSDLYYGCIQKKKGEKRRSPAWCDRILWQGKGLHQEQYSNGVSRLSDHRPVRAVFSAVVLAPVTPKSLLRFFEVSRSDEFEHE